jgi:NAD(P)-dependent dehydrogenase (short-subunit alcohol dehydrogenase family)
VSQRNQVALLVGAGDAIGAAVARRFAVGGYKVCIARRDAAKSDALIEELRAEGCEVHAVSVDARQEAEVQNLFARVEDSIGPIEVCLFNAGSNWPALPDFWWDGRRPVTC